MWYFICILLLSTLTVSVYGDCWDTGCQLDSWAVKGCPQYGRIETGRKPCSGGNVYTCCTSNSPAPAPSPGSSGSANSITYNQFSQGVSSNGYPAPSQTVFNAFKAGLPRGQISSTQEAAMALANFLQESDGLRAKREYACVPSGCPGSYTNAGCERPGQYYYGRGYIQLSWCYNYGPASQDLYGDDRLLRDPDMVARDEQVAWDTAFWFWSKRVHNAPGVQEGKFGATTRAINGGLECDGPHKDNARRRYAMYGKVRAAFGLAGPGDERGCYN